MNFSIVPQQLPTGKNAIRHFETIRWGQKPKCAYCQSENLWERRTDQRFQCKNCNNTFSVMTNTHLHNTKMPLEKWLKAFSIVSNAQKVVSAKDLERSLKVTYPTAYHMSHKLRDIMTHAAINGLEKSDTIFEKIVQCSMRLNVRQIA